MADFKVIEPNLLKLDELALITHNFIFYENQYEVYKDPEDEAKSDNYKRRIEVWLHNNLRKVPKK